MLSALGGRCKKGKQRELGLSGTGLYFFFIFFLEEATPT